jgi:hypothetical protein
MKNHRFLIQHLITLAWAYFALVLALLLSWYFAKLIIDPFAFGLDIEYEPIVLGTIAYPYAAVWILVLVYICAYLASFIRPEIMARHNMIKLGAFTGIIDTALFLF